MVKVFQVFFICFVILIYKLILSRLFSLSLYLALPIIGFLFISTLCSWTDSLQPVLDHWLKLHLMMTLEDIPDTVTKAKVHLVDWWLYKPGLILLALLGGQLLIRPRPVIKSLASFNVHSCVVESCFSSSFHKMSLGQILYLIWNTFIP